MIDWAIDPGGERRALPNHGCFMAQEVVDPCLKVPLHLGKGRCQDGTADYFHSCHHGRGHVGSHECACGVEWDDIV